MGKSTELIDALFLKQLQEQWHSRQLYRKQFEHPKTLAELYAKSDVVPSTVRGQFFSSTTHACGCVLPCGGSPDDYRGALKEAVEACLPVLSQVTKLNMENRELVGDMLVAAVRAWDFRLALKLAKVSFASRSPHSCDYQGAVEIQDILNGKEDAARERIEGLPRPLSSWTPPRNKDLAIGVITRDAALVKRGLKAITNAFKRKWNLKSYATPAKLRHYGSIQKMIPDIRCYLNPDWFQSRWAVTWMSLAWYRGMTDAFDDPRVFSEWIPWELCCPEPSPDDSKPVRTKQKPRTIRPTARAKRDLLFRSVSEGDQETVRQLIDSSVDLDARNRDQRTPLMEAAQCGQVTITRELLRAQANPDLLDVHGRSILGIAASRGDLPMVEMLLKEGIKPDHAGSRNRPLADACATGHLKVVKRLLKAGADPNLLNDSEDATPLTDAIEGEIESEAGAYYVGGEFMEPGGDYVGIVRELLKYGAKPNHRLKSAGNSTALHLAAGAPSAEKFVNLLLADGANVNARDEHSETPLHVAAQYGKATAVRLMLAAGAKKSVRNRDKETPSDLAKNHAKIRKLLS